MIRTFLVCLLVATPLVAQTGDCFDETETSTTWQITSLSGTRVKILYTYYDESSKEFATRFGSGSDVVEVANDFCVFADEERTRNELEEATVTVCGKPANPENVLPAFPERIETDADAPTLAEARQRNFHRYLIRLIWPEPDTVYVSDCLLDLWQWVNTQGTVPYRRRWWDNTVSGDGEANGRFGGLSGAESILSQDEQYHGTELEDYQ